MSDSIINCVAIRGRHLSIAEIEAEIDTVAVKFNGKILETSKEVYNDSFDPAAQIIEGPLEVVRALGRRTESTYVFPNCRVEVTRNHFPALYSVALYATDSNLAMFSEKIETVLVCKEMLEFADSIAKEDGKIFLILFVDELNLMPSVVETFFEMAA